jgi:CheY-like chemotaxis protein
MSAGKKQTTSKFHKSEDYQSPVTGRSVPASNEEANTPEESQIVKHDNHDDQRALVVDDDADIRELLTGFVEILGLSVSQAEDGLAAYNALQENEFDYVFVDLHMPEMNGLELIEKAKKELNSQARFVIVTGSSVDSDFTEEQLVKCGVDYVLEKPFTRAELSQALDLLKQAA